MTSQLIIGQTNVFLCIAEYNLSTIPPYRWQGWWQVNGEYQYDVINENPFCDPANKMVIFSKVVLVLDINTLHYTLTMIILYVDLLQEYSKCDTEGA